MFFTSGIIIAFFCFAFYLIWDQFLKKDSRLSTGLQVLRKKMHKLENVSTQVNTQVHQHLSALRAESQRLEELIKQGQTLCGQLSAFIKWQEQQSALAQQTAAITKQQNSKNKLTSLQKSMQKSGQKPVQKSNLKKAPSHPNKESIFQFGQSPFTDIDFTPSNKDGPDPSL